MRLTTRGKLAVTALADLASHSHGQPVALPAISARQGISLSHLEDMFSAMRRAGLVVSSRGPAGGYRLGRAPALVTVAQIVVAAEPPLSPRRPRRVAPVASADMTAELWEGFQSRVAQYLESVTLADLLAHQPASAPAAAPAPEERKSPKPRRVPAANVPISVFTRGMRAI